MGNSYKAGDNEDVPVDLVNVSGDSGYKSDSASEGNSEFGGGSNGSCSLNLENNDASGSGIDVKSDIPAFFIPPFQESDKFAPSSETIFDTLSIGSVSGGSGDLVTDSDTESELIHEDPKPEIKTESHIIPEVKIENIAKKPQEKVLLKEDQNDYDECDSSESESISFLHDFVDTIKDSLTFSLIPDDILKEPPSSTLEADEFEKEDQYWEKRIGDNRRWDPGLLSYVNDEYQMRLDSTGHWTSWDKTYCLENLKSETASKQSSTDESLVSSEEDETPEKKVNVVQMTLKEYLDRELREFMIGRGDSRNLLKTGHQIVGVTPKKSFKKKKPLLGLDIVDGIGQERGIYVKSIDHDSPFSGVVKIGDQIVKVNSTDLRGVTIGQATTSFKKIHFSQPHAVLFRLSGDEEKAHFQICEEEIKKVGGGNETKKRPKPVKVIDKYLLYCSILMNTLFLGSSFSGTRYVNQIKKSLQERR